MLFTLIWILASIGIITANPPRYQRTVSYKGQQVLECPIMAGLEALDNELGLDIWGVNHNGRIEIRVKNDIQKKEVLTHFKGNCSIKIDDLETAVALSERQDNHSVGVWHEAYHTYDEIVGWYKDLSEGTYSDFVTFIPSIGRSTQQRDQPAVKITAPGGGDKPAIYWQCQIHAREWISGATCMYVVEYFLENYRTDDVVKSVLDEMDLHVVPFTNPDGYAYTWSGDRMWRKNRQSNSGSSCVGTDLNRNYPDHWGEGGSSSNPCSDTYMGTSAGNTIEVQNTIAYFKSVAPVYGAIDWHSFSQLILRPYGWTRNNSPDETLLKQLGDGMRDAARIKHGKAYTSQKSIDLYTTTGTASDWFYGADATSTNGGYKAAGYTIELRDTGTYGFRLPANQIIPQGEEMVDAAKFFCEFVMTRPIKT